MTMASNVLSSNARLKSGTATVEFRFKGESDASGDEFFRLQLSDGATAWRVVFFNDRCNGAGVSTSDWDTYQVTVKEGKITIRSERQGTIASDLPGMPSSEPAALLFGTFKASKTPATRSWSLDFIRWNTEAKGPEGV